MIKFSKGDPTSHRCFHPTCRVHSSPERENLMATFCGNIVRSFSEISLKYREKKRWGQIQENFSWQCWFWLMMFGLFPKICFIFKENVPLKLVWHYQSTTTISTFPWYTPNITKMPNMRDLESHLQNLKTNPLTHSLTGVGLPYAAKQKTKQAKQTYNIPDTKASNKKPTITNQHSIIHFIWLRFIHVFRKIF